MMVTNSFRSFARKTTSQLKKLLTVQTTQHGVAARAQATKPTPIPLPQNRRISATQNRQERLNIGVLGVGRIGQMHLQNVLQNNRFNVSWVLENSEALRERARETFDLYDTPFFLCEDYDALLEDSSLDGVLIFTPTPTHTDFSMRALSSGKAVFTEKPAGENKDDIRKCFELAEQKGKPFLVGFNRRFDATFVQLYENVKNGSVGKLQYLRLTARDSPKPSYDFLKTCDTTGCNILADMSVHCVDQLVWLTQSERPEHIYVTTHAHDETMAEFNEADAIGIIIKYKNGLIASLDTFRESTYGYDIRLEVLGSEGMLLADNPRDSAMMLNGHHGGTVPKLFNSFPQRFETSFKVELDHFADCIQGKSTPKVTKQESILVSEIIDKGLESFRTKQPAYF